jgi:hypothetical protein
MAPSAYCQHESTPASAEPRRPPQQRHRDAISPDVAIDEQRHEPILGCRADLERFERPAHFQCSDSLAV